MQINFISGEKQRVPERRRMKDAERVKTGGKNSVLDEVSPCKSNPRLLVFSMLCHFYIPFTFFTTSDVFPLKKCTEGIKRAVEEKHLPLSDRKKGLKIKTATQQNNTEKLKGIYV